MKIPFDVDTSRDLCGHVNPPSPEEIDGLLAAISATGDASEAGEIVEEWIERRYGYPGAFTANLRATAEHTVGVTVRTSTNGGDWRQMTFANEDEATTAIATSMLGTLEASLRGDDEP